MPSEAVPQGLAILDAPDVDSVEERNRVLAAQLLAAADLWIFVTSAARYADQVPWDFLRQAAERSTAVAIVLDRTPEEAVQTVSTHLARMLASRGLKDSPLFIVREGPVDDDGLLPADHVAEVRRLAPVAGRGRHRARRRRPADPRRSRPHAHPAHLPVADAAAEQSAAVERLRQDATKAYDDAVAAVVEATADGTLLRGEVLARWQEFVGTGELLKGLETRVGRIRDRLVNTVKGRPQQAERVTVAVESGLETAASWSTPRPRPSAPRRPGSSSRRARGCCGTRAEDLGRASRDLRRRAERSVREWQADVLEMVRTQGADKRSTARFLAFGVNGLSVALMVVVFSYSYGLTGAEVGIAGGSAVLGQKLLEAVFGDQAVRSLAERARRSLEVRVTELFDVERARYTDLLDCPRPRPRARPRHCGVRHAGCEDARYAGQLRG